MKNYLKTQRNQFGQTIGFSLEENVTASPVQGNIFGQYVQLVDVADGITDQAAGQLWKRYPQNPMNDAGLICLIQLHRAKYSLKDSLDNLFGFKDSTHFLIQVVEEIQGWVALLNPRLGHGVIEIGNVYFSHKMKKSKASTETIFLCY